MRPAWRQVVASQYLFKSYEDYRWRSSEALERFLTEAVDGAAFRDEYARWQADTTYRRDAWQRASYAHWYLGHYTPLYVASLQRALLAVAPARDDSPLRVLDVGVGVGTTTLALLDLANTSERIGLEPPVDIDMTCLDHDVQKLEVARRHVVGFSAHLQPEAARSARGMGEAQRWRCADVGELPHDLLTMPPFDLIVLGNVVMELERERAYPYSAPPEAQNARRELVETLIVKLLAPGGVVLQTEHAIANAHDRVEVICRFRRELLGKGILPTAPCQSAEPCVPHDLGACECVRPFTFEWPEYYTKLTVKQPAYRHVQSLWSACRRAIGDGSDAGWSCFCDPPAPLELDGRSGFNCPRCGGPSSRRTSSDVAFFGCDAYMSERCEGSITEVDGAVRDPANVSLTRDHKRQIVADEVRRIVQRWERERTAERERTIVDFTFVVGCVYRNPHWSYELMEVSAGGERLRVRRLDTGEETTLVREKAARLHMDAPAGGDEPPPPG
ncbi:MAG TPA: class I SAM-dependent methyltransferase [Thermoleophilia bacterium]|nr:class I SAM-dependent methyltransferase [Thermoleophilia bacterium]